MLRIGVILIAAVAALGLATDLILAGQHYPAQKVVYHINGNGGDGQTSYRAALGNIRNHMNAVGDDNIEVKVVLHSDGVDLLRRAVDDKDLAKAIDDLYARNVRFDVCANTLNGRHIDTDLELHHVPFDIVPSGVAELSRLQQQGYTYIKP